MEKLMLNSLQFLNFGIIQKDAKQYQDIKRQSCHLFMNNDLNSPVLGIDPICFLDQDGYQRGRSGKHQETILQWLTANTSSHKGSQIHYAE